jgi:hypothetical protein
MGNSTDGGAVMENNHDGCFYKMILTEARWRRLPAELRAKLRRALGSKRALIGRPVLAVACELSSRRLYELAVPLYLVIDPFRREKWDDSPDDVPRL